MGITEIDTRQVSWKKKREDDMGGGGCISKNGIPIGAEVFHFLKCHIIHQLFRFVSVCAHTLKIGAPSGFYFHVYD